MQLRHTFAGLRGTSSLSHTEHFFCLPVLTLAVLCQHELVPLWKHLVAHFAASVSHVLGLVSRGCNPPCLSPDVSTSCWFLLLQFPSMPASCFFMPGTWKDSVSFHFMLFSPSTGEHVGSQYIPLDSPISSSGCFGYICPSYSSHAFSISEFQFDPSFPSYFLACWHSFVHVLGQIIPKSSPEVLDRLGLITKVSIYLAIICWEI